MFKRPFLLIAVFYAFIIILLRPFIPVPENIFLQHQKQKIPIISQLSSRFVSVISKTTAPPYDSLLASIIFGTGISPLDPSLKESYKKVGLAHLLVASGTQVSILIGFSLMIVRSLKIPLKLGIFFVSAINVIFTIMTGCGPSMMGQIGLFGLLLDRKGDTYNSLAISALILMIFDPLIVFDIGFQLTFAATWALIYFCPILEEKKVPPVIAVSLAPILATTPIVFYNFNQLSIVALPVNILVVPWVETLTVIGFISTLLGSVFLPAAEILNFPLFIVLKILNGIVYTFCNISFSNLHFRQPGFLFVLSYYAGLIYVAGIWRRGEAVVFTKKKLLTFLLFLVCIFIWNAAFGTEENFPKDKLQVSVIDVKQGDSIFIRSPSGKNMLIDGGPKFKTGDAGKSFVLPFLYKQGVNKLDVVVLTHPHDDHVGGLSSVLSSLPVGLVIDSGQPHTSRAYKNFLRIISEKKIPYRLGKMGELIDLGEEVLGEILHPIDEFIEESALNNNSVVIRLVYKNFAMMLVGDLEKEGELAILGRYGGVKIRSSVLKVGHHGSNTASSEDFLNSVDPKLAVISVGKRNNFNHPHKSTLENLDRFGIRTLRTDINGTITILSDGNNYEIR